MSAPARILVVDDDRGVADTVRRILRSEGYSVEVAHDGPAALERVPQFAPALVVLDLMMPGMDGVEVCRRLRASGGPAVLMLTARTGTRDRVQGLDSGADDYLVKPFAYEELLARVRALLRRAPPVEARTLGFDNLAMDLELAQVRRGERTIELTATEFALLRHFLEHPRQVLSRSQLLDAVWPDTVADDNVVAVYISYLRLKLEAAGERRLLQTVRGFGYALREA